MLAKLRALFGVVIEIVLLRRGPDSLPGTREVFIFAIVALASVNLLVLSAFGDPEPVGDRLLKIFVALGFPMLWYRAVLGLAQRAERYQQAMSAMLLTQTLFVPALVPLMLEMGRQAKANPEAAPMMLASVLLALAIWMFTVMVRIVRAALEYPTLGAVMIVIGQELASFTVFALIFMPQAKPA
jgi:hypothetical protein